MSPTNLHLISAGPNFHQDLFLGLKSNSYPCNKRHSIRVIASIPRGLLPGLLHLPGELDNLQFVIAICLETRQVPVRICYALKIRSPSSSSFRVNLGRKDRIGRGWVVRKQLKGGRSGTVKAAFWECSRNSGRAVVVVALLAANARSLGPEGWIQGNNLAVS